MIRKKEFAIAALDLKHKIFIVHVAGFNVDLGNEMHPLKRAQIAHLKADEVTTGVSREYTDFADVFLSKLVIELLQLKINNNTIKLVDE